MSHENVGIVRRAYDAFNRGGTEACISEGLWSPEVVWDVTPSGIPGLGTYRGREEVKRFFEEDWFSAFPFDEWEVEVEEVIDAGDRIVSMSRQHGRGAGSGVVAELELAQVSTLRDGQIVRIDNYLDRAKALHAAGLSE
jgi:ketosteroid isomerase-like protein